MKSINKNYLLSALIILSTSIHFYGRNELSVEKNYSNGFFVSFSELLRSGTGKLLFSIGDLLYGILFFVIIAQGCLFLYRIINRKLQDFSIVGLIKKLLITCLSIYVIFNIFWGLNYNRKGIASQTNLSPDQYNHVDLNNINKLLVEKANHTKSILVNNKREYPDDEHLFTGTINAYHKANTISPFLNYSNPSIKKSLWGWLGNYWGFTGYYNPFTGEAHINTTVPKFQLPFVCCHEVAHQLGYAKENEANFVAFLVAHSSGDTLFLYSAYLDLFLYANRNLYGVDSASAKQYRELLSDAVKNDIQELIAFNKSHRNIMEPVISNIYDFFLRFNQQPQGMMSYDQVTGYIIAYYKKKGDI